MKPSKYRCSKCHTEFIGSDAFETPILCFECRVDEYYEKYFEVKRVLNEDEIIIPTELLESLICCAKDLLSQHDWAEDGKIYDKIKRDFQRAEELLRV